jgi:hypothetical protein
LTIWIYRGILISINLPHSLLQLRPRFRDTWQLLVSTGKRATRIGEFLAIGFVGYTNPLFQTDIPFGSHSHWIQPWRGYMETMPTKTFIQGAGVVLTGLNPDLICEMLSKNGVKATRFEIGWGNIPYPAGSITNATVKAYLQACKKWGIRPIILLNGNQGQPCPTKAFTATAAAHAPSGSYTLRLSSTAGFVIGKTGLSNLAGQDTAAQILVTAISGNTVTLSAPLPDAINEGASVPMATLLYRPWSKPGSADYNATMAGWQAYVVTVGELVSSIMGPGQFDLEVWNELTFGSAFLDINNYYNPSPYTGYDPNLVWAAIVQATANTVTAHPSIFDGCEVSDGFANTIPWPASSLEPARVTAISKHPYAVGQTYPLDNQKDTNINALLGQEPYPPPFCPTYSLYMPDYAGTASQTETMIRDLSPITTPVQGVLHGRNTRPGNPCYGWITECGYRPSSAGVSDASTASLIKAKAVLRYYSFYLNKGVEKVCLYATSSGGDLGFGIVQDNFLAYCASNSSYPAIDAPYTSLALLATERVVHCMSGYQAPWGSFPLRQLKVVSISDTNNHFQFSGDGSDAHPNLYDREVVAFLPFQGSPTRFVIPFYVMTKNLVPALVPEPFTITLQGVNSAKASLYCYDPINDDHWTPSVNVISGDTISFTTLAADYPYILIVTD